MDNEDKKFGLVSLIGAGPGDHELISLKGKRKIEQADLVIYDYLANPKLLEFARDDATLLYVGKQGGNHSKTQDEINQLIVKYASEGKSVARLKGGDPYIFGRGAEEAEELVKHGIGFEIIPGITAASAASAYAGIPLTHRSFNTSVSFITGHEDPTKDQSSINWNSLAKSGSTLVFYMGIKNLPVIVENLIGNGLDPETDVAIIRWGTYPYQQTITGKLNDIVKKSSDLKPPSIIVIGQVVSLREKLGWFENRVLFGKKIVLTRARNQISQFAVDLSDLGADVIEFPTIETVRLESYDIFDDAMKNIDDYDYLIFTSVNGIAHFLKRIEKIDLDIRVLANKKIITIGPETKKALEQLKVKVDIIPDEYRAEAIVETMQKSNLDIKGKSFLIIRAKVAREILPEMIVKIGGQVKIAPIYETIIPKEKKEKVEKLFLDKKIDMVTFTSSSTVSNFIKVWEDDEKAVKLLKNVKIASIGPITSETIKSFGLKADIEADSYTIKGLIEKIISFYSK